MENKLKGITIDDTTTRDMDDAVWAEPLGDGWHVMVMIADVTKMVPFRSEIDQLAMARVETRYYASGNSPMLPRRLSDQELSLWPGKPKEVLTIDMMLDEDFRLLETKLSRGVMISEAKLSYSDIPGILSNKDHPQHAVIEQMSRLANGLTIRRRNRGALVFYDLKRGLVTGEEGSLRQLRRREDTIGYVIIQELMILANMAVAEYAVENDIPILYRNHTARSAAPEREDLIKLLESTTVVPVENIAAIRHTTHMMFNKADYGAAILGHFGLNLAAYTHFTSPIRRYADLVNHRQIRAHVDRQPLPHSKEDIRTIALHINRALIERDAAKSEYMKEKADKKAETALLSGEIEGVSDSEFERITKLLIRNGADCPAAYCNALMKRLDGLPIICTGLILLQAPGGERWAGLKKALLEQLAVEPHKAATVFNLAQQLSSWQVPAYDVTETCNGNLPIFTARAAIRLDGKLNESAEFTDMTKKGAMQRASVGLLATILGLPAPEMKTVQVAQLAGEDRSVEINTSKDPIAALQEYGQAKKITLPDYSFEIDGSPGRPNITCTCTFASMTSTGKASSKQRAKRLSAKAMIYTILNYGNTLTAPEEQKGDNT